MMHMYSNTCICESMCECLKQTENSMQSSLCFSYTIFSKGVFAHREACFRTVTAAMP